MKSRREGRPSALHQSMGISEALFEATTHPFIVKVWLEETAEEAGRATWRGHITHVPSGTRRYLHDLGDILAFIIPYLEGMGIQIETSWRLMGWLKGWNRSQPANSQVSAEESE